MTTNTTPQVLWLSTFDIDPLTGDYSRAILTNLQARHTLVMRGFPDDTPGPARATHDILFRAEPVGRRLRFIVQASIEPDWTPITDLTTTPPAVKPLRQVLTVPAGSILEYRLTANPTRRQANGRRVALIHDQECLVWLNRRAREGGFEVDPASLTISKAELPPGYKTGHKLTIQARTFTGLLRVTDTHLFAQTITRGIGRGRAYGCGLLSVLRPA